ncbi:MAG: FHA domain-containing protein [Pseudomonadota bacterium]
MARLVLSLGDQVLAEYNMTKERYTIGRLPDNDVRIDNPSVSGHHCLIINILNDSFLEDLNSTNGTYVGGKLIKKHALQNGDSITIGHHQLRYVESSTDPEQQEFEATMVITPNTSDDPAPAATPATDKIRENADALEAATESTSASGESAAVQTSAIPEEAPKAEKAPSLPTAKLQVLSGNFAGRELDLSKALTTLGRPGIQVAAITRRGDGFYIVHVESGEGRGLPQINGEDIGDKATKLNDNDVVKLAGVKMGFYLT